MFSERCSLILFLRFLGVVPLNELSQAIVANSWVANRLLSFLKHLPALGLVTCQGNASDMASAACNKFVTIYQPVPIIITQTSSTYNPGPPKGVPYSQLNGKCRQEGVL